jgi:hypothetical protein
MHEIQISYHEVEQAETFLHTSYLSIAGLPCQVLIDADGVLRR